MKKIKTLITMGVALLILLFSCKRAQEGLRTNEIGDTYATVSLFFGAESFRTQEQDEEINSNSIGLWEGNDAIKTVDVYLVGQEENTPVHSGQYQYKDFIVEVGDASKEAKLTPKKAIKTTAGIKTIYVLVNAPQRMREKLALTDKIAFERAWQEAYVAHNAKISTSATGEEYAREAQAGIASLATQDQQKDVIMMSNAENSSITIQPNVSHDDAKNGVANQVTVYVKRAAARVIVTTEAENFELRDGGVELGTVCNITYATAQGEKKLYIQQKREGQPTVIKTPAYGVTAISIDDMDENYDYSDLYNKTRRATISPSTTAITPGIIGKVSSPVFMLEANHKRNTQVGNAPSNYDGDFRIGNTPYVLVRAKFKPKQAVLAENNDISELAQDGTFYIGTINGRVYVKKEYVINPSKGGIVGQKHRTYKGGKVLYYAYINPDNIDRSKVLNAPIFRNNVYHIHISGIKAIGYNWNPIFPEDPETPNPKNPDPKPNDPNEDPEKPLEPNNPLPNQDTHMSVAISILKWNVHSYKIFLDL